ncbi:hypothetical protein BN1708_016889 [Verticillium longisporum]|uniref:Uncharacterized protein n=1 Tax=Verticillium longisporum TaxID=100787 RepID=A0A0G4N5S8_VERLO|nr:hypothetical protein BN1708_016889 [Verticillium longisporum]
MVRAMAMRTISSAASLLPRAPRRIARSTCSVRTTRRLRSKSPRRFCWATSPRPPRFA